MEKITFGSVCSGIEAASVAWEPIGWRADWFAEIESFPSAVLAHHWPHVPNLGDMTKIADRIKAGELLAPSVLVGGTPCQAFSVAGMRNSLDDARGQLTLEYVRLADAIDSRRKSIGLDTSIIVWENVPGVLNTKDNAFGCFLGALAGEDCELQPAGEKWGNAGCVFGPKRAIAWRIIDAQYFGVAQRRRRVFVVASARDGFDPTQILFEFDGVRRDSAPSREAQQDVAAAFGCGASLAGNENNRAVVSALSAAGVGVNGVDDNQAQAGHLIVMAHGQGGAEVREDGLSPCLTCNHEAPIIAHCADVAPTMGASGPPYSRTGNARVEAEALVACFPINTQIAMRHNALGERTGMGIGGDGDPGYTLLAGHSHAVCYAMTTEQTPKTNKDCALTLTKQSPTGGGQVQCVAYGIPGNWIGRAPENGGNATEPHINRAPCLTATDRHGVAYGMQVRRLTPREYERLQGFPDDHTMVPFGRAIRPEKMDADFAKYLMRGGNKTFEQCLQAASDGPRYKALGNSMAVPCMRWIGERINNYLTSQ